MTAPKKAYASGTKTAVSKTDDEIKKALRKYGAEDFLLGETGGRAQVLFQMKQRRIIIRMPLPDRLAPEFTTTVRTVGHRGRTRKVVRRTEGQIDDRWEQARREKWRALLLCIKAKLESVESGVETFEQAFFAHLLLPSGETMSEWAERDENANALNSGKMPPLLGGPA